MSVLRFKTDAGLASNDIVRNSPEVDFRFHEPEALADCCTLYEFGWRLRLTFGGSVFRPSGTGRAQRSRNQRTKSQSFAKPDRNRPELAG